MDTFLDGNMSNIIFKRCLLQNQLSRRLRRLVQDMEFSQASTSLLWLTFDVVVRPSSLQRIVGIVVKYEQ